MRNKAIVFALVFLSGCAPLGAQLATLKTKDPQPGNFGQSLAREYLAYGESLAEEGHPIRADHFAEKGLAALDGGYGEPEAKPGFETGRAALLTVLTDDVKEIAPEKAARAQLLFDCWVEKENVCKESFDEALSELQFIADMLVHGQNRYPVDFPAGSAELDDHAKTLLDIVARRVSGYGDYRVELQLPGKRARLTNARLLAIEKGLISRGVNAGRMEAKAWSGKTVELSTDRRDPNTIVVQVESFISPEPPEGR